MQAKAQVAQYLIDSGNADQNQWPVNMVGIPPFQAYSPNYHCMNPSSISAQNSLDSMDPSTDGVMGMGGMQNNRSADEFSFQPYNYSKKRPSQTDLSELQALALRMMRD